jgi:hypothetical protein
VEYQQPICMTDSSHERTRRITGGLILIMVSIVAVFVITIHLDIIPEPINKKKPSSSEGSPLNSASQDNHKASDNTDLERGNTNEGN